MVVRHLLLTLLLSSTCLGCRVSGTSPPSPNPRAGIQTDTPLVPWRQITDTSMRLYSLVALVDSSARQTGRVPTSWDFLPGNRRALRRDAWGRLLRLRPAGGFFEIRSPGQDHLFETPDDIFVLGRLGSRVPCESHRPGRVRYRSPPCSDGSYRQIAPADYIRGGDCLAGRNDRAPRH